MCPFTPRPGRRTARRRRPNALQRAKAAEIERLKEEGRARIAELSDREFLVAGVALYAGEGSKTEGSVRFTNGDPRMIAFFCARLRRFFPIDESRLRVRVSLHQGLDLAAAEHFWSELTGIPRGQFRAPYRAIPKVGIRHNKHRHGCPSGLLLLNDLASDHGPRRGAVSLAASFRGGAIGSAAHC